MPPSVRGNTVATGPHFSCAIDGKGRIVCFGMTGLWWLDEQSATPQVISPDGVVFASLAATSRGLCALDEAGGRWCWGEGYFGEVNGQSSEVDMKKMDEGWQQISLTLSGGCGVRAADGALWCWGAVGFDEPQASPMTPTVQKSGPFLEVVLGSASSGSRGAAIQADGKLLTWVRQNQGIPGAYENLAPEGSWVDVATQWQNTCAIRSDGTLWCWGENDYGQCGLGHHAKVLAPTMVGSANDWKAIQMGHFSACGVRGDGDLYCWGWNRLGQLGVPVTPSTVVVHEPTLVLQGVPADGCDTEGTTSDFANNLAHFTGHACARRSADTVACWGDGARGQLGNDFTGKTPKLPTLIPGGEAFSGIAGANLLRKPDGSVWRLGRFAVQPQTSYASDSEDVDVFSQVPIPVASGVSEAGLPEGGDLCAIFDDGSLGCVEHSSSYDCNKEAAAVCEFAFVPVNNDKDWVRVASNPQYSTQVCALKADGSIWCKGSLSGDGTGAYSLSMVKVAGGHTWLDLSSTLDFACGVRADHSLWCWGSMDFKKIPAPAQIGLDTDWSDVSGRCARKQSGELFCWDQFGKGFSSIGSCASYSSGNDVVCFVKTDGSLWCDGDNTYGQVGIEGEPVPGNPVRVGQDSDWSVVSVGERSTCALKTGGGLWCWGVADGRTGRPASYSDVPVEVTLP
ncbi:RCC1 domain-containing protein [Polyangium jinanense]|uniref:BNR repeat domain protein n=1 Tax=Polyangium jinanense TaxID=2829994 RepID=A0A9X3XF35_9BACT|nr:hypothetical protein [Polyangium jinanense]MDC3957104.1 hypothetical protein [Polyangium jinanense]MDC3986866.1 hypothetical protein [Polyangium jinanense]